jgi:hypothetical protein
MNAILAYDPGYGNIKLYGPQGGLVLQSAVSVAGAESMRPMLGLRQTKPPLRVETAAGVFRVGPGAHDWGRPVENLDVERLTGSPEMMALWYGSLSRYDLFDEAVDLIVGLPIHVLTGEDARSLQTSVRNTLRGHHTWKVDGEDRHIDVEAVLITSQPVGAMFDYLLDECGQMPIPRQVTFRGEIGVLGIGMNTLDLLVVRNGSPVQRFVAGDTLGVRRLLEYAVADRSYSLAERDALLRAGRLPAAEAVAIWQSEVLGFIERQWSTAFRRFDVVVATGGGSWILRED